VDLEARIAYQRQEARIRELETIIAILVHRHGHGGGYVLPLSEAFATRAELEQATPCVGITFEDDTLVIFAL
jgi:hypothetical protein